MSAAVTAFAAIGYFPRSMLAAPTGERLFEYDYLLAFVGPGELASVQRPGPRLVGAFSDTIGGRDGDSS